MQIFTQSNQRKWQHSTPREWNLIALHRLQWNPTPNNAWKHTTRQRANKLRNVTNRETDTCRGLNNETQRNKHTQAQPVLRLIKKHSQTGIKGVTWTQFNSFIESTLNEQHLFRSIVTPKGKASHINYSTPKTNQPTNSSTTNKHRLFLNRYKLQLSLTKTTTTQTNTWTLQQRKPTKWPTLPLNNPTVPTKDKLQWWTHPTS